MAVCVSVCVCTNTSKPEDNAQCLLLLAFASLFKKGSFIGFLDHLFVKSRCSVCVREPPVSDFPVLRFPVSTTVFLFYFIFGIGFLCLALDVLEHALSTRLSLNSEICLPLPP